MADKPYRSLIGSLMFAMVCSRPDIAYALGVLCRFMADWPTSLEGWHAHPCVPQRPHRPWTDLHRCRGSSPSRVRRR
jgi:hypothetical protein